MLDKRILSENPLEKMRYRIPIIRNERGAFSLEQVQKLISFCKTKTTPEQKWPFLLMAYTGMRNGEVMQLRKEDVKECSKSKLPYIEVTEDAGDVKSLSGNRCIPIHSELLKEGFLTFVNKSEKKIFKRSGRYLTYFYASVIKPKLNLPDFNATEKTLSLYSLRHTVATQLTANDVVLTKVQQILGHSISGTVTEKYYIDTIDLEALKNSIELLKY